MCIVMLFNQGKEFSFRSIKEQLKFDDETLIKNLKTLMMKGYKLLNTSAEGR